MRSIPSSRPRSSSPTRPAPAPCWPSRSGRRGADKRAGPTCGRRRGLPPAGRHCTPTAAPSPAPTAAPRPSADRHATGRQCSGSVHGGLARRHRQVQGRLLRLRVRSDQQRGRSTGGHGAGAELARRLASLRSSICPWSSPSLQRPASFWADRYLLGPGECTTLHWSVADAQAVYLDEDGSAGAGVAIGVSGRDSRVYPARGVRRV